MFSILALDIWSYTSGNGHVFNMTYAKGKITVKKSGMYFIYAQVYYTLPTQSARHFIYVNGIAVALGHSELGGTRDGSIYISALKYLREDDEIWVIVVPSSIKVWTGSSHSYFGAFMI